MREFYSWFIESDKRDQILREAFKETNDRLEDAT